MKKLQIIVILTSIFFLQACVHKLVTVPVKVDLSTIDGEDAWAWARCWTRCRALHGRADLSRKMDSTYAEARFEDYRDAVAFKLSMPEEWL